MTTLLLNSSFIVNSCTSIGAAYMDKGTRNSPQTGLDVGRTLYLYFEWPCSIVYEWLLFTAMSGTAGGLQWHRYMYFSSTVPWSSVVAPTAYPRQFMAARWPAAVSILVGFFHSSSCAYLLKNGGLALCVCVYGRGTEVCVGGGGGGLKTSCC